MTDKTHITSLIKEHKTLFLVLIIALLLIELEIFAVAIMKSGQKSRLQVLSENGNVIYETDGKDLSDFNKYYFEKTFGPLEDYEIRLKTIDRPFPFRGWFVAAVGIPVGVILLVAFVLKAMLSLLFGEKTVTGEGVAGDKSKEYDNRLEKIVDRVSRFNIFTIGFLIFFGIFLYWVIPNMIIYFGKVGEDTILKYKWFFLSIVVAVFGFFIWVVYLRYQLAKKSIDNQAEVEKYRLELEYSQSVPQKQLDGGLIQLEYNEEESESTPPLAENEDEETTAPEIKQKSDNS